MDSSTKFPAKYVVMAWLGFLVVLATALTLGEGVPIVIMIGITAFVVTCSYAVMNGRTRTAGA